MATSVNPVTGDLMKTKGATNAYREGWDRIFANKETEVKVAEEVKEQVSLPERGFFLQITEYERGWGSKPDGCAVFLTEEAAREFCNEEMKKREKRVDVTDYYVNYDIVGYRPINKKVAEALVKSPNGRTYVD